MTPISRLFAGSLILLVLCGGCGQSGSQRPKVSGIVTFKGSSVGAQTLALYWDGPKEEFFVQKLFILPDGSFAGDVSKPGTYKVVIEIPRTAQEGAKIAYLPLPRKYRDAGTSDLKWEIKDGENKRNFDLQE